MSLIVLTTCAERLQYVAFTAIAFTSIALDAQNLDLIGSAIVVVVVMTCLIKCSIDLHVLVVSHQ